LEHADPWYTINHKALHPASQGLLTELSAFCKWIVTSIQGRALVAGQKMCGVGDIATVAEDEWLVQFNRTDGKKQLGTHWINAGCPSSYIDISF
jgi:hypothetical protein